MLKDLVLKNRSYRRFDGTVNIAGESLVQLVELARLSPSSRNQQALKFIVVDRPDLCGKMFPFLAWAGYLKDWAGPVAEERPTGYIIILGDTQLGSRFDIDLGICAQTILLGATEKNLGGCMIGSLKRDELRTLFSIPDHLEILLVIALGEPIEKVEIEAVKDGEIRYWRDVNQVHHVPKRAITDILLDPDLF